MDKIVLSQMRFYGYHGVFPEETKLGQRFMVDVKLFLDLTSAGRTDRLEETVNYASVTETIRGIVEGKPFKLIEALAERIAAAVLGEYEIIQAITVRVLKPDPPFDIHFQGVSVEIHRKREES
ncbi:dihydroneopterin aldolase [Marinicrinis lubricantis]|uniref:7,8-dihydroneopterin aldolase n=1 Tax=Marinicrinis lubricantis TaxID=2086470 RepID=A0ABW1IPR9_9BACL